MSAPLPGNLATIERVAGRKAAIAVALLYGGQRLLIPTPAMVRAGHSLADAVGGGAALRIAQELQGLRLRIPRAGRALARHFAGKGFTAPQIAAATGVDRRTAKRYIQAARQSPAESNRCEKNN